MELLGLILNVVPPRGPKYRKSNFWDQSRPWFHAGVQTVEKQASEIDFGHGSAQGSKTWKIKLLGSILAMAPPRGPKRRKSMLWDQFRPWLRPGSQNAEHQASGIDYVAKVPPRPPEGPKSNFWDPFWPWFDPGVQTVENEGSGVDFGHGPAQGSKTLKMKLLGSISAMVLPRGPKGQKPSLWERFRPSFRPRVQISKVKLLGPILAMVPPSDRKL